MIRNKLSLLIPILFLMGFLFSSSILAQNSIVRGFVYEKETGEPVIFTNVYLAGTSYGSATDVNGYFVVSKIPPGSYTLMVTYLGFDTLSMEVTLKPDQIISKKLYLNPGSYMLGQVQITGDREEARTKTNTSVVKITPKQIKKLPTIGGTPDLAQYLQVLPGVIFTGDQGGQLYIRGGSPIQNKVLLDGMIIYNPFHSIGLFSVFDTEILRNADVYTGGFGAEYGGRVSSIMDITTRDGNKSRISGNVGASTFGANIMIEGPIKKMKEGGKGSSSFILSAKNSYLEQSSKLLYDYIDEDGLPFNFLDLYGKVSLMGGNGNKVNFFGYNFTDRVNNYRAISDYHWESFGVGSNFLIIPSGSPVLMEGHFSYSSYKIALEDATQAPRTSLINGFNAGFDFSYFIGKDELKYGIELLGFETDYIFSNSVGVEISQSQNTTELSAYVKYKKTIGKWLIEPGFRLQWYASLSDISPEPRLALKYNATERLRIKLASGFYSQNLISAHSDRDIVNLFNGFLSGPDNLPEFYRGKEVTHNLQKSEHIILGFEYDLTSKFTANIEGYYKNFSQLTNINRQKLFDESDHPEMPDIVTKDYIIEDGYATGVDFTLKYDNKGVYVWVVYSLGNVVRNYEDVDGQIQSYNPHYDRRHNINVVVNYVFGAKRDWELNGRWNFGTGFPFTLTQGFIPEITFEGGIYTDYTTVNENLGTIYGDLNAGRLPTYHRLDFGMKKIFAFNKHTRLEVNAGVTNVYNRKNVFYKDRVTGEIIYQLPFMPSIGASLFF